MKTYKLAPHVTETMQDSIILSLRKSGFSAYAEKGAIVTDASITAIGLVYGNSMVIKNNFIFLLT